MRYLAKKLKNQRVASFDPPVALQILLKIISVSADNLLR
ncbi:hypothetical protein RV08_GL002210 [Enterococcus mundtii]|nr:hypothetical protein RV08_GL002210 [Enterococcus mundtii]